MSEEKLPPLRFYNGACQPVDEAILDAIDESIKRGQKPAIVTTSKRVMRFVREFCWHREGNDNLEFSTPYILLQGFNPPVKLWAPYESGWEGRAVIAFRDGTTADVSLAY